jgi:adenosine deaminase
MGEGPLSAEDIRQMPKVELHRHLEGALPPEFFLELAKDFPVKLPADDIDGLREAITMVDREPDFEAFLKLFETYRTFYVDKECIKRAVREAIRLAAEDNIIYLELRYNPLHFAQQMAFRHEQVIEWITEARDAAAGEFSLQVELIATINRDDPVQESIPIIEAAIEGMGSHFVGVDIAGNELATNLVRFAGVLRKARKAGLGITVHAGEVGPAANVKDALRLLGAHRIGHGIHVLDDPEVLKIAQESGAIFEVCPTSNLRTGAVKKIEDHPIADMARAGLAVTINTDDPAIYGATLSDDYELLAKSIELTREDFLEANLTALQGAFRPHEERDQLAAMFEDQFASTG